MAITFVEKRKKLKYLLLVLVVVILLTVFVLWQGFFAEKKPVLLPSLPPVTTSKKIEINEETLKNPVLEKLESFETIPSFEEKVGRENPFIPY